MRKINILDLLCDDLIEQDKLEKNNLYSCIDKTLINSNINKYILPYIQKTYKLYDLDFDFNINSTDEITKYKSLRLLRSIIKGAYDLIGVLPDYFKAYEKEYDTQKAYEEICSRVFIGNILDIKKGLKHFELDENWKTVLDELKERIDGNK